jgi:hypothetical protein
MQPPGWSIWARRFFQLLREMRQDLLRWQSSPIWGRNSEVPVCWEHSTPKRRHINALSRSVDRK